MNFPLNCSEIQDLIESDATCASHGDYVAKTYFVIPGSPGVTTGCPKCAAERKATDEANRVSREQAEERREREAKISALLWKAGIPPRFASKSFDDYVPQTREAGVALRAAKRYVETFPAQAQAGRSLILAGGPGTGKTHLATAIGMQVIRDHQAVVLFGTVSAMLRAIKDTYRKESASTETEVLKGLGSADLLILDEIGVQVGSEHEKQLMFEVLNERYQSMRPTILISNLDVSELESFLGHRVMDRYRECGVVLAFGWESFRGQKIDRKSQAAGDNA